MKFQASLKNYGVSAKKVREVAPVIKGLNAGEARLQLDNLSKGSSEDLSKLLQSAVANAKNSYNVSEDELIVSSLIADESRTLKRWRPRAYGRAAQILKRTCHVTITLETIEKDKDLKKKKIEKKEVKESKKTEEKEKDSSKAEKGKKDEPIKKEAKGGKSDLKAKGSQPKGKMFRRKAV